MIKSDEINTYYVDIDNNTIEQYEPILSRFDLTNNLEWIAYKREIKINKIIDDNLFFEFDINFNQNYNSVTYLELDPPDLYLDVLVSSVSSVIENLTIRVVNNKVKFIKAKLKHLTTHWGKVLTGMERSGVKFKLGQVIVNSENSAKIYKFYLTELSKSDERNIRINQILE